MNIYIGKNYSCGLNYIYSYLYLELNTLGTLVSDISIADIIVFPGTCCGALNNILDIMSNIYEELQKKKEGAITFVTGCMTRKITDKKLENTIHRFLHDMFDYVIEEDNVTEIINIISQKKKLESDFGACILYNNGTTDLYISRGCTNNCSFCKMTYQDLPTKSVDFPSIIKNIKEVAKLTRKINFLGTNTAQYGIDFGYTHNLADIAEYIEYETDIEQIDIYGYAFKDGIQNNLAKRLKKFSKVRVIIGSIETGSPRLLKMMNKGYTIEQLIAFWDEMQERYEKELYTDIIAGFPTETMEDIELTLKLIERLKPKEVKIHTYQDAPFIPSHQYKQLSEKELQEHYDIYKLHLKK